jgi:hypothetical protein
VRRLILIVLAGLAIVVGLPGPASASAYAGYRHRYDLICIQQDVDLSMGLAKAASEWNAAGVRYFVRGDRSHPNGCAPYVAVSQTVFVSYYSAADGKCSRSLVWQTDGYVTRSEIRVNLALLGTCTGYDPARNAAMMMHELGHDGGLAHVRELDSILCADIACPRNLQPSARDLWRMGWRYDNPPA